jgi:segregation and condensation protein A
MAATLIQIKSKMLLPQEEVQEEEQEEEDPRAELVKRLLEYQKFKEAAVDLRQKELLRQNIFTRASDRLLEKIGEDTQTYFEANLFDLISAFSKAVKDVPREVFYEVIKDEFTVDQKIHDILHMLLLHPVISVSELFSKAKSKLEIIANFLAVLELIRLKEIIIVQQSMFAEIKIIRNKDNISPYAGREK